MPRRYSEEEAQRIFAHVAERQRDALASDTGLSIEDLQEAARAAGLDPGLVLQAAVSLDAPAPERSQTLLGAPVEVVRQRMIPDPVSDETWAQIVAEARRAFGGTGSVGQIGRLREWTLTSQKTGNDVVTRLALEPTPGGARLVLSQNVRAAAFGFSVAAAVNAVLAVVFVSLFAFGLDSSMIYPAVITALSALLMGAGTPIGLRVWSERRAASFDTLLDRAELAIRAADDVPTVRSPAVSVREPAMAPPLDLDERAEPPEPVASARSRTRS